MQPAPSWSFPPFRLDPSTASLWRHEQLVPLPPKPFAVLACLVAHAGEVLTKEQLLDAVWPETTVTEGVLKRCILQIRQMLGDNVSTPQYVVTLHRRGYRFIAPVVAVEPPKSSFSSSSPPLSRSLPALLVGRETALAHLQQYWRQACQGRRQLVFITGEAGIGKTTLVDAFVAQVAKTEVGWCGHGQCLEQYGVGEPYLPLLEAFGRLGNDPQGPEVIEVLRRLAPSWLIHLPGLLSEADGEALQRRLGSVTRERMLRELAEAVEALTAVQPLVLVLEDLHWSDGATLDWLSYVARRRDHAALLVLGTYRPEDALRHANPVHTITSALIVHGQGQEVALDELSATGVAAYLRQRFGEDTPLVGLAQDLQQRTTGNPLFLTAVVDDFVQRQVLRHGPAGWDLEGGRETVTIGVPENLRKLLMQQFEQLSLEEQALLEAASLVGEEWVVPLVAAALDAPADDVEARSTVLARRGQFLQPRGIVVWPDGTVAARFGFRHALYRASLYDRVPPGQQARGHRQIGRRLEVGYAAQARTMAAELAEHFVRGRDMERAVQYLQCAGEQAVQRSAYREAIRHFTRGLELLQQLPDTPEHTQQEICMQTALGPALIATRGPAAPEVEQTYARAQVLCAQIGETPWLLPTLQGLWRFNHSRGKLQTARELGEQLYRMAQREATPMLLLESHEALEQTLFFLGEYAAARLHLEQGIALINPDVLPDRVRDLAVVPGVRCRSLGANILWCLGFPTQAIRHSQEGVALAQAFAHPHSLAVAFHFAAYLHRCRREASVVQAQAETLLTLSTAQGFPLYAGYGTCWRGWALAVQGQGEEGIVQLRQGLTAVLTTGQTLSPPLCLILLAEAMGYVGQLEEGLCLLAEALAALEASGREDLLTEAYQLQGEFLLLQARPEVERVEACFQQALTIARQQQAKSWELRVAMSLSRLWQQQGKRQAARALLAPIYGWFTEGFDTADLQEARVLLDTLSEK